jgi:AcrR family transcriptional regulator
MVNERSGSGDIERTLQLLWSPDSASARGPKRSLSVLTIVDRAIALADAGGLDAVSMRSVAAELGVGTMTLYRYIPTKAELLDLMLDRVYLPATEPVLGWRAGLEQMGRELWRLYATHTWVPQVDQARPVLGPNAVRALDSVMSSLRDSGLTDQEKVSATVTIESFVTSLARTANSVASAEERTAITHEEFWSSQEPTLVAAMESGQYAHMADLGEDAFDAPMEETFEFGLQRILDGIEALLRPRTRPDR